jgi:nitroimidazol reductase NimA-like FMN-containing flavoprotein (pyridoxamine 5'-phosphate oxidase superfamily)
MGLCLKQGGLDMEGNSSFRKMRLEKRRLPDGELEKLLAEGIYGVLAVAGDEGYPYAVPVNYAYEGGRIYFHCAKEGHKLDAIKRSEKLSFCVVAGERVLPERFTTAYRSAIAFGKGRVVEEDEEKRHAMRLINAKYSPGLEKEGDEAIVRTWDRLHVVAIKVEHLMGKELK